jgi:hypothetical protein
MRRSLTRRLGRAIPLWLCLLAAQPAQPYSVLSHEALVDALWATSIRPVLLRKFPDATREQLKEAHGYAYGGAVIQDMGFYPHGDGYFSDLTHYVRPADFIEALLADAHTLDELAFAIGALSHYSADCLGHRYGTNIAEPQLYPKLGKKYGASVTYEDNPSKHLKTEYGFDVAEVAKANFAPQAYHDFIGFYVATPLLDRAFRDAYGLGLTDLMDDVDAAVGSYRRTISKLIPLATRVAWAQHQDEIRKSHPGVTRKRFLFVMRRSSYERYWGKQYDRPSLLDRILAFLLKLLPPIGPLKTLRFKALTPPVEAQFMHSFDLATAAYRGQIESAAAGNLKLENLNFDVGAATPPATYGLQDDAYAFWLDELASNDFTQATPPIRQAILSYYSDLTLPFSTKKHSKDWRILLAELDRLKAR